MATRAKATEQPQTSPEPDDILFSDYDEMLPHLNRLKDELGIEKADTALIHVWLIDANNERAKVGKWRPADFNIDTIARTFGSGKYEIRLYADGSLRAQESQVIKLTPADEAKVQQAIMLAKNPTLERAAPASDISGVVAVMSEGFNRLGELIVRANATPPVDPLAQMEKMAGVMRIMMPAAPASTQPDFMSMLNMIKTFNDVTGAGKTPIPDGADPSTALMMKAFEAFGPVMQKAMEAKAAGAGAAPTPAPAPNAETAAPALPAPAAPVKPTNEDNEEIMLFKLQLKMACKSAASGADAADYAEDIYPMLAEDVLRGMGLDEKWFDYLVNAVPDCAQHKAWFEAVRAAIVDFAVEDGIFVRAVDGALTLAPDPVQTGSGESDKGAGDAADAGEHK